MCDVQHSLQQITLNELKGKKNYNNSSGSVHVQMHFSVTYTKTKQNVDHKLSEVLERIIAVYSSKPQKGGMYRYYTWAESIQAPNSSFGN